MNDTPKKDEEESVFAWLIESFVTGVKWTIRTVAIAVVSIGIFVLIQDHPQEAAQFAESARHLIGVGFHSVAEHLKAIAEAVPNFH